MMRHFKKTVALLLTGALVFNLTGCGSEKKEKSALDAKNPVTVTVWNYYNGDQLTAFDDLVSEFNKSVGEEKGIVVVSVSQGDINTLADELLNSVDGKAGAQDVPTLASVYSETAYILDQKKALASLDKYFSKKELKAYVPDFIEEGRFNSKNELMLFPILKSTEVFTANETDWAKFADATGVTLDSINTQEDLVAAAEKYYEWTDSLTPKVKEDGKALYGRDSMANYIYIGSYQLGHELFPVKDGKMTADLDKETFKTLWDNYYVPYINGYFGAYGNFRSEDAKTGKILALTSSSSSVGYMPTEVISDDDDKHDIETYMKRSLPFKDAVNEAVVQQGASFCMMKSNAATQEGAVEFMKWFTDSERNKEFSLMSGYSPVTVKANDKKAIESAYDGDTSTAKGKNILNALLVSAESFTEDGSYTSKPFEGSKDVRSILDKAMQTQADTDRKKVEKAIKSGKTRKEAVAAFCTESYFESWYTTLVEQINNSIK